MSSGSQDPDKVKVAVVTGRHPFDVRGFHHLFRGLDGIDAYVQHMEDFAAGPVGLRDWYDVVLFYHMYIDTPAGGGPWFEQGVPAALEKLGESSQGIFVLHHAILGFPDWPLWSEIVGIENRGFGFYPGETVRYEITRPDHPITRGLTGWEMVDETYTMDDAGEGSDILITADHPKSMKTIAWTRQYKNAPVFCFQCGHDDAAFSHPTFREIVRRGIEWLARKS